MSCDWTNKISSLMDGELAQEEAAQALAHLETCAACRAVRDDFMLLRRQLSSYRAQVTPEAQREALREILSGGEAPGRAPTRAQGAPRGARLLDSLPLIFGAQRTRPALVGALAALLLVSCAGLFAYFNTRRAASPESLAVVNANSPGVSSRDNAPRAGQSNNEVAAANAEPTPSPAMVQQPSPSSGGTSVRQSATASNPANRAWLARRGSPPAERRAPAAQPPTAAERDELAFVNDITSTAAVREFDRAPVAGDPQARTARYVEQAQLLLRSFRNARLNEADGTAFELAHERQRSQKLLYQNIVLRREAASTGNLPVEKLLSSLEPILIDIANLPDNPAQDDVRSIRERMQRRNIVALLQVNAAGRTTRSN
jgi:negative regulator of sigma E activity